MRGALLIGKGEKLREIAVLNVIRPKVGDKDEQTRICPSGVTKTRVMMTFASRHRQIATMKLGMGDNKQKEANTEKVLEAGGPAFSVPLALSEGCDVMLLFETPQVKGHEGEKNTKHVLYGSNRVNCDEIVPL